MFLPSLQIDSSSFFFSDIADASSQKRGSLELNDGKGVDAINVIMEAPHANPSRVHS